MALKRMDNVGIVVDDLTATMDFFRELGLELEGRATVEGEWAGRVTGLGQQRVEVVTMVTPDGHGRLEISRFLTPPVIADHRNDPVNSLGYLRVMFAVDDLDKMLARPFKLVVVRSTVPILRMIAPDPRPQETPLGRAVRTIFPAKPATPRGERHREANWLRDVILGGQDGLV